MTSTQIISITLAIVLFTSFGQLCLKFGANTNKHLIFNRYVFVGYTSFVIVLFLSTLLMRTIDFKYFSVITGLNYMSTILLAAYILKEKVSTKRYVGCIFVTLGSILFSL